MNYRQKQLFRPKLFQAALFGPLRRPAAGGGVGTGRSLAPARKRRRDTDDDVLLFLLR